MDKNKAIAIGATVVGAFAGFKMGASSGRPVIGALIGALVGGVIGNVASGAKWNTAPGWIPKNPIPLAAQPVGGGAPGASVYPDDNSGAGA